MKLKPQYIIPIYLLFFLSSCEESYVPKPRGFQRIIFPERAYKSFTSDCNFTCDIPVYSEAKQDDHPAAEKCWYNVTYLPFNATLHLSYKPIKNKADLFNMIEDSRMLVYKHTIKADEIYETVVGNNHLNGMLYELSGNTATNFQFYVTDSTNHYLRGALYFNETTNIDSILPALDFLKRDIIFMLQSIRWND